MVTLPGSSRFEGPSGSGKLPETASSELTFRRRVWERAGRCRPEMEGKYGCLLKSDLSVLVLQAAPSDSLRLTTQRCDEFLSTSTDRFSLFQLLVFVSWHISVYGCVSLVPSNRFQLQQAAVFRQTQTWLQIDAAVFTACVNKKHVYNFFSLF